MNDIIKMFGQLQGLSLQDNEETFELGLGYDFEDPEHVLPNGIDTVLATDVSTADGKQSVVLITDKDNTFYSIRVIDDTGKYTVYTPVFVKT